MGEATKHKEIAEEQGAEGGEEKNVAGFNPSRPWKNARNERERGDQKRQGGKGVKRKQRKKQTNKGRSRGGRNEIVGFSRARRPAAVEERKDEGGGMNHSPGSKRAGGSRGAVPSAGRCVMGFSSPPVLCRFLVLASPASLSLSPPHLLPHFIVREGRKANRQRSLVSAQQPLSPSGAWGPGQQGRRGTEVGPRRRR